MKASYHPKLKNVLLLLAVYLITGTILFLSGCGRDDGGGGDTNPGNSADQVFTGPAGAPGADGLPGPQGPQGKPGPQGEEGPAIMLFDAANQKVGYLLKASDQTADVFLLDGKRAVIDMELGHLKAPLYNFFCLYESNDCSGSCYVYDSRWLEIVVLGKGGNPHVAPRNSNDEGGKTMQSYTHDENGCTQANIVTLQSYKAPDYGAKNLSLPFPAPLYWRLNQ